jgi:hypothetical protein
MYFVAASNVLFCSVSVKRESACIDDFKPALYPPKKETPHERPAEPRVTPRRDATRAMARSLCQGPIHGGRLQQAQRVLRLFEGDLPVLESPQHRRGLEIFRGR